MTSNFIAYEDNEIVGYFNGKAIVKTESDQFYFSEIPESLLTFGETIHPNDLTPITALSDKEQKKIRKLFSKQV